MKSFLPNPLNRKIQNGNFRNLFKGLDKEFTPNGLSWVGYDYDDDNEEV